MYCVLASLTHIVYSSFAFKFGKISRLIHICPRIVTKSYTHPYSTTISKIPYVENKSMMKHAGKITDSI